MDDDEILSILAYELSESEEAPDLETPLNFYLGNPLGNEQEGRSTVVSTDVADAIEWIVPQVMRSLFAQQEVCTFDPTGPEDVNQAQMESAYVYDVITKENPGYVELQTAVRDALLHNFGLIKVWYDDAIETTVKRWSGLTMEQVQATLAAPDVEVLEYEALPDGTYNLAFSVTREAGQVRFCSVPPEQFRYNADHGTVTLCEARFTAQVSTKSRSELLEEGVGAELLDGLDGTDDSNTLGGFRRSAAGETGDTWTRTPDASLDPIDVTEAYMRMDVNGDGIAERVKILAAGHNTPTRVLSVEEIEEYPWIPLIAILQSHKFRGLSIYDRMRQIQLQKTAVMRSILDNFKLCNNARWKAVDGLVNYSDLVVARPGGVVRVKDPTALEPMVPPPLGGDGLAVYQALSADGAGRTGVSPEGNATPQKIGANVGSEGVESLLTDKQELVGLIVRNVAEITIKPLCLRIQALLMQHVNAVKPYQFRGQWMKVNPAQWNSRRLMTVRVGTGSGNTAKQVAGLTALIQFQSQAVMVPGQSLVSPENIYAAWDELLKLYELVGAERYLTDPGSPQGQQAAQQAAQGQQQEQQQQLQAAMAQLQFQQKLADAEIGKAQAQMANVQLKGQVDHLKQQLEEAKAAVSAIEKQRDMDIKAHAINVQAALKLTELEQKDQHKQLDAELQANQAAVEAEKADEENEAA